MIPQNAGRVNTFLEILRLSYCFLGKPWYNETMNKYQILDKNMTVSISAPVYMASMLDAALVALREQRNGTVSDTARKAIISYARLMRGVDVEQAAGVLAITQWLRWINEQSL